MVAVQLFSQFAGPWNTVAPLEEEEDEDKKKKVNPC